MTGFTDTELQLMLKNMGGFTGVETMMICSKIIAELDRRACNDKVYYDGINKGYTIETIKALKAAGIHDSFFEEQEAKPIGVDQYLN